ncbi:MAG: Synechococcus T7-like phage [Pseudomonadota bacterium]|jgi:thymidylate synthase (FAD)
MSVNLRWATPNIDAEIAYQGRVSNVENQNNPEFTKLLNYLMTHGHVSPFEMANMCVEINTTRDISRQILRHRSFSFQEYSGRYAEMTDLGDMLERECRLQDKNNRQSSLECDHLPELKKHFSSLQHQVWKTAESAYHLALSNGIAKEQARALLPEGLTPTRLYMNGNMRSWIFYLKQRLDPSTQKEHRIIAEQVLQIFRSVAPVTAAAFFPQ